MACNTISLVSRLIWKRFRWRFIDIFEDVCSLYTCFSADSFHLLCCIMPCESSGRFLGPPGIHILQTIYGTSEETNSNCCTAAVAVYFWLVLPIICIATGTLQEKRMYWYGQVEACGSDLLQHWAEFQHCMVYYATKLETCINAEGCCHSEHLLWRCLPDLPAAIHHNRFFS